MPPIDVLYRLSQLGQAVLEAVAPGTNLSPDRATVVAMSGNGYVKASPPIDIGAAAPSHREAPTVEKARRVITQSQVGRKTAATVKFDAH